MRNVKLHSDDNLTHQTFSFPTKYPIGSLVDLKTFSSQHIIFTRLSVILDFEKKYSCCRCPTQIIFDSLFGKDLNGKLRVYAVQFVHHICLWSSDKVINMMGPVLLSGMTKLISEDKQVCIHFLMALHDCET